MIFRNALRTPDGTVLESHYRHDYKCHKDSITENIYMVDGGVDYLRRSCNGDEVDLSVVSKDDDHGFNRQNFTWGTYGPDGTSKFRRVALCDMDTDHIEAILETQKQISADVRNLFHVELLWRRQNG